MSRAPFYLAWRYVCRHRLQSLMLAGALALVAALPLCLRVLVQATESAMRDRAVSTPQLIGARGSALDLMLAALYFKRQPLPPIPLKQVQELRESRLGKVIPLDVRFHAQESPIVGTEIDYFAFRGLRVASGQMMTRLGDCVLGARVAHRRGLGPGDALFSSQEQVFDMAGVYPLKMRIKGVLAANGTSDDDAVFVDLKTAWLIQGLAHGHDDVAATKDAVLKTEAGNTVANASVRMFNEVTEANINGFHFHGDQSLYELSAILVIPNDAKAEALLAGRYLKSSSPAQLIRPSDEFDALMTTLFQVQTLALTVMALTLLSALVISALVFALSFRLRRREFATLADVGVSPWALLMTKFFEISLVGIVGLVIAASLALIVQMNAATWVRYLLA
ncbi:MAG: ABC transporter permease [Verrucomicrobia bacterium]|nr:ABC transporter permease [Verrucomicrobiota bacterium]